MLKMLKFIKTENAERVLVTLMSEKTLINTDLVLKKPINNFSTLKRENPLLIKNIDDV